MATGIEEAFQMAQDNLRIEINKMHMHLGLIKDPQLAPSLFTIGRLEKVLRLLKQANGKLATLKSAIL